MQSLIIKLRDQIKILDKEIKSLKSENDQIKKMDAQSEAVKELEKLSKDFRDKTTRLIVLETELDQKEFNFSNQKKIIETIRRKLDDSELQLRTKIAENRVLSDKSIVSDILEKQVDDLKLELENKKDELYNLESKYKSL